MLQHARALTVASLGVALLLALADVSAQNDRSKASQSYRSSVDLVVLDVSVLDKDRRPVPGLTARDFTVLEDGRPQTVSAFDAIDLSDTDDDAPGLAAWTREAPWDVRRNTDVKDGRIIVIVVDDATPMPAADVPNARAMARQVIEALGPRDLACVVFALNKGRGQEFTTDRARLLAAVDRFDGAADNMLGVDRSVDKATGVGRARTVPFDELDIAAATLYFNTMGTLRGVAESLAALPGRRKALVFISTGIPLDLTPKANDPSGVIERLGSSLQESFRAAQRANVNIYALDAGGLRAPYGAVASASPASPGTLNREFLQGLAENTGGMPAVNTNDVLPVIRQMRSENGSYYLLGYAPSNGRQDGRFRKIEVRVSRPGATVRTRSGYYEPEAPSKAKARPVPAATAVDGASLLPKTDLTMQVCAMPFAVAGKPDAGVAIVVGIRQPTPRRLTRLVYAVDLRVDAYGPDGRRRGSSRAMVPVTLNHPGVGLPVGFELLTKLELPPGRYRLRLAAESSPHGVRADPNAPEVSLVGMDADTDPKSGSVHSDLDVPDFLHEPLSLSGVALSVRPAVASGPPGALSPLVPVVPTTLRDFSRDDQVTGFVRVAQGGTRPVSPVRLTLRIVDRHGATVQETTETLDPERFGVSRLVDYPFDVLLQKMAPGPHLLVVEAVAGDDKARRDVRLNLER